MRETFPFHDPEKSDVNFEITLLSNGIKNRSSCQEYPSLVTLVTWVESPVAKDHWVICPSRWPPVSPLWVHDSANCVRCGKHYMCCKRLWTTLDLCWKHSLYEHYTTMCIPRLQVFSVERHFNDLWRTSLLSGEELTSLSKVALCKNEQVKCVRLKSVSFGLQGDLKRDKRNSKM